MDYIRKWSRVLLCVNCLASWGWAASVALAGSSPSSEDMAGRAPIIAEPRSPVADAIAFLQLAHYYRGQSTVPGIVLPGGDYFYADPQTLNPDELKAVMQLGKAKAAAAAPILIQFAHIDEFQCIISTGRHRADRTVIEALAAIGEPSVFAAVAALSDDHPAERDKYYVRVIAVVQGVDRGQATLCAAAEAEKDPAKKARLQRAIPLFKDASETLP